MLYHAIFIFCVLFIEITQIIIYWEYFESFDWLRAVGETQTSALIIHLISCSTSLNNCLLILGLQDDDIQSLFRLIFDKIICGKRALKYTWRPA